MSDTSFDIKFALILVGAAAIGGSGGGALHNVVSPPRPDPFTGSDGRDMREDMKQFFAAGIELQNKEIELRLRQIESGIRKDMPPTATKARIRAIEVYLQQKEGSKFEPPTYEWQ